MSRRLSSPEFEVLASRYVLRGVVLALILAPAGISCLGSGATEDRPGEKLESVRISVLPLLSYAPLWIAVEEGYFRDAGVDVELVRLNRTAEAVPALSRGHIDAAAGSLSVSLLRAVAQEERIRLVADKGHLGNSDCSVSHFLVSPQLFRRNSLREAGDLRNLRIAFQRYGLSAFLTARMLEGYGLTLEDVRQVTLPRAASLDALKTGAVDMAVDHEPMATLARRAGLGVSWKTAEEVLPGFQLAFLIYGVELLDRRSEVGERVMNAYLRGVRRYLQGKTERNLQILEERLSLSRELLRDACWINMRPDGRIDFESVLDFQEWALREGLVDAVLPKEDLWEPRFLESARPGLASPQ